MSTNYPTSIDSYTTKVDGTSDILAADTNNLQDAVVAIQNAIGTTSAPNFVKATGDQTIGGTKTFSNNFGTVGGYPAYTCRAWVNFNGTGTVAIRASGNVSSITDNGVGNYTINLTTALVDTSYVFAASSRSATDTTSGYSPGMYPFLSDAKTVSTLQLRSYTTNQTAQDSSECNVVIFR